MSITTQILKIAPLFKLDPILIASIVEVESGGVPGRVRYEEKWKYLVDVKTYAKLLGQTEETEFILQKCSWGPMQVMGSVARQYNFTGYLIKLCDEYLGVYYGCYHLDWLRKFHRWDGDDLIAAYNAGGPYKNDKGEYKNKKYVDNVKHWIQFFKENGLHDEAN